MTLNTRWSNPEALPWDLAPAQISQFCQECRVVSTAFTRREPRTEDEAGLEKPNGRRGCA